MSTVIYNGSDITVLFDYVSNDGVVFHFQALGHIRQKNMHMQMALSKNWDCQLFSFWQTMTIGGNLQNWTKP